MIIIFGLGNPGEKYRNTRHNMGFQVVEQLEKFQISNSKLQTEEWKTAKSLQAEVLETAAYVLVKPQTYMNLSGEAVKATLKKYDYAALGKKDFSHLFIVYDDLDLPVGKYKLVFGSGPKVHNGVNSVQDSLGTDQFWHVRIGVDGRNGDRSVAAEDYVLSGFSEDERVLINKVIDSVVEVLAARLG